MKCRLPKRQEYDFLKLVEELFSRGINPRSAHLQVSLKEEDLPETLNQIYAMCTLIAPHLQNLTEKTLSSYTSALYSYVDSVSDCAMQLAEDVLNNIPPLEQVSVWWNAVSEDDNLCYGYSFFCGATVRACANSLAVAESLHTALECYLKSLNPDDKFVTGGAISVASKCGCKFVREGTLLAQLCEHYDSQLDFNKLGLLTKAAQKRKLYHYITGTTSTPKELSLADLNSWYLAYLDACSHCYAAMFSAYGDSELILINSVYEKAIENQDRRISYLQSSYNEVKSAVDKKDVEISRIGKKYTELSKTCSEQAQQIKSLTKRLKEKPLAVTAQPKVTQVVVEKSRDCTAIIEKQKAEIAKLTQKLEEMSRQQKDSEEMLKTVLSGADESMITAGELSSEDKQLLKCIRAHFVMPDFKAFRQLKVLMPSSTFEFVPKESIGKLVVPKSKEIYLFCTSHAGHSVYESWFRQIASLAAPHVVFNNTNIDSICHLVLEHYKRKVLHI